MKLILTFFLCLLVLCFTVKQVEANGAIGRTSHDEDPDAGNAFDAVEDEDENVEKLALQFMNLKLQEPSHGIQESH